MVKTNVQRALLALGCTALSCALGAQGVSVAPADKADTPHNRVKKAIEDTHAKPVGVEASWMIPPEPHPFNWAIESEGGLTWEYGWEVTHVRFNHNAGQGNDGMSLRWTFRSQFDHKATRNAVGSGEYDVLEKRNEPVLYKTSILPVVQVRIQVKDAQGNAPGQGSSALIRADAGGGGSFMSLPETLVRFDANGISIGDKGYVNFQLLSPVPPMFGEYTVRYRFTLKNPKLDNGAGDMGPQDVSVLFDELARIDAYSVFDPPRSPWNDKVDPERSTPWVSALAFLAYPCGCADQSDLLQAVDRTAKHLFWGHTGTRGHAMKYEHKGGAPGFGASGAASTTFQLTSYMTKRKNGNAFNTVNCTDQACAVHTLIQLAWPGQTEALYMKGKHNGKDKRFGYVNPVVFVGGTQANNPFYEGLEFVNNPIVGTDDLWKDLDANGRRKRSAFEYHAAVRVGGSIIVDACMGAALPGDGHSLATYLSQYRDTSTQAEQSFDGIPIFALGQELSIGLMIR